MSESRYDGRIAEKLNKTTPHDRDQQAGLSVVVVGGAGSGLVRRLPEIGRVIIGRRPDADLHVDHPSISRNHAALHVGERLEIEDTESSNGTFVHGQRLVPGRRVVLAPGDTFECGEVVCLVRGSDRSERLRQLRAHGDFERRLHDEVVRARETGTTLGVVRISVDRDSEAVVAALLNAVAAGDVVAQYALCEYELLLIGADREAAARIAASVARELDAQVGVAMYPSVASCAEQLLAAACDALLGAPDASEHVIIEDAHMRELHALIPRVARGQVNVLLLGETGVGKEVIADALHRASPRAERPMLRLNCAAFTEPLLEGELFGYEKGAFTGATGRKIGLLESATGGIVFLDEIGELAIGLQAKLLRVIESGRVRRLGAVDEVAIDVVYIAATNRDLQAESAAGRFRSDLFFRLDGFAFNIPPLRERKGEILPLARQFARGAATRMGDPLVPRLTAAAEAALVEHAWPGNIRELRNVMERAILLAAGVPIDARHLQLGEAGKAMQPHILGGDRVPDDLTAEQLGERDRILVALAECRGNQSKAAKQLSISRRWLSTKMARYGIPRARD